MKQSNIIEHFIQNQVGKGQRVFRGKSVSRVISFTSGKGGVGKTSLVVNLAIGLARQGKSVLIMDADLGLANIDVLLGLQPQYNLSDLFEGRKTLEEIMLTGPEGISIIPAASGDESICNLNAERRLQLMDAVENLAYDFDYLLIDTQAGIGPDVIYFNTASSEIVCVITPEPTSLTDAYGLIKVLAQRYGEKCVSVVVNEVVDQRDAIMSYRRLEKAVERFLHIELKYVGHIPFDKSVSEAVKNQRALLEIYPSSSAGLAVSKLAKAMDADFRELRVKGGMQFFFKQLLEASAR